jgi:RNB domain
MEDLLEYNVGNGLCHAWYSRRFLASVRVLEIKIPHAGLGLDCYVQWSSPIRRFSDLQVHGAVKRYLRRKRVYELHWKGEAVPTTITASDLGLPEDFIDETGTIVADRINSCDLDENLNYMEGIGLIGAARTVQRTSQQYWLFEYVRRQVEIDPAIRYTAVVLGCVDPVKRQYAIYVKELGLEHRYTTPDGGLDPGKEYQMQVASVTPRAGLLQFVRVV